MKTPGLGINPVESFNTLNLQSPVEKSDNLPQVGSTQTSPAAKLILNSAVTRLLQDLEICLGRRLPFRGTFPFLVDLQPLCVIGRGMFLVDQDCRLSVEGAPPKSFTSLIQYTLNCFFRTA